MRFSSIWWRLCWFLKRLMLLPLSSAVKMIILASVIVVSVGGLLGCVINTAWMYDQMLQLDLQQQQKSHILGIPGVTVTANFLKGFGLEQEGQGVVQPAHQIRNAVQEGYWQDNQQHLSEQTSQLQRNEQSSSWVRPSTSYLIDSSNDRWEDSEIMKKPLPNWMKQYFRWHKEMREQWHLWKTSETPPCNVLQVTCLVETSIKCGGLADRLLSLPFLILIAAQSSRLLLIDWNKPAPLTEFLVVPGSSGDSDLSFNDKYSDKRRGVDWTVTPTIRAYLRTMQQLQDRHDRQERVMLKRKKHSSSNSSSATSSPSSWAVVRAGTEEDIVLYAPMSTIPIVQVKFQSHDHGATYYNSIQKISKNISRYKPWNVTNYEAVSIRYVKDSVNSSVARKKMTSFERVFRHVWDIFFVPSPRISEKIQTFMKQHNLFPQQYVAAHVRALYGVPTRPDELVRRWSVHAIHCAYYLYSDIGVDNHSNSKATSQRRLFPETPALFFASDSYYAMEQAFLYGTERNVPIAVNQPDLSLPPSNTHLPRNGASEVGPLHLDKAVNWMTRSVSDFDSIFVDLYVLAQSRCITYGMGGYGYLASLLALSHDSTSRLDDDDHDVYSVHYTDSCSITHMTAVSVTECPWSPDMNA